jgi:hypothetical protein
MLDQPPDHTEGSLNGLRPVGVSGAGLGRITVTPLVLLLSALALPGCSIGGSDVGSLGDIPDANTQ